MKNKNLIVVFHSPGAYQQVMGFGVGQFSDFSGEGAWKKRGGVFSPSLEDKVHAMTLRNQLTPKLTKEFQTMTASLQNSTKSFIKRTTSNLGYLKKLKLGGDRLVALHPSRNKFWVIVVKTDIEADSKISQYPRSRSLHGHFLF